MSRDAASEELDDGRAFRDAEFHETDAGDPPTVPALGELPGAQQDMHFGGLVVQIPEEAGPEVLILDGNELAMDPAPVCQLAFVADVDDTKGFRAVADGETEFTGGAFQIPHMQDAADRGIEDGEQNVVPDLFAVRFRRVVR